jgi:GcrA cell cycle regulator
MGLARETDFTFWTPGEVEKLRSMVAEGFSASCIAEQLSRKFDGKPISKSTVLHKIYRLGISKKRTAESYKSRVPRFRKPPVPFAAIVDTDIPIEQRRTIETLERGECKWPVGDPDTPEFFFCGGKAYETGPYCSAHHHRAFGYTPTPGRKFSGFRF